VFGTADGVNERGLAVHMLYFPPADYGARDAAKPGLQAALDNSAIVDAAQQLRPFEDGSMTPLVACV
jgi:penicillin V acylase-like amidase (Ntn superfamily)